jgi:hypothetical protein
VLLWYNDSQPGEAGGDDTLPKAGTHPKTGDFA